MLNEQTARQLVWTSSVHTLAGHSGQAPVLATTGWPTRFNDAELTALCGQHFVPTAHEELGPVTESWDCVEFAHTPWGRAVVLKRHTGREIAGRPGAYLSWVLLGDNVAALQGLALASDTTSVIDWPADATPVSDDPGYALPDVPHPAITPSSQATRPLLALLLQAWDEQAPVLVAVPDFRTTMQAVLGVEWLLPAAAREAVTFTTQHPRPANSRALVTFSDPSISRTAASASQRLIEATSLAALPIDQIGSAYVETAQRLVDLAADGVFSDSVAINAFAELSVWARTEHDLVYAPDMLDDQTFLGALSSARGARWVSRPPVLSSLVRRLGVPRFVGGWLKRGDAWNFGDSERSTLRHELGVRLRDSILTGAPDPDLVHAHQMVGGDERELDTVVLAAIPDNPGIAIAPAMLAWTQDAVTRHAQDASDGQLAAWAQHDALVTVLPPQAAMRVVRSWLAGSPLPPTVVRIIADAEAPWFVSEARRHLEAHRDPAAELRRINEIVSPGVGATLTEATRSIVQPPEPAPPRPRLPGHLAARTESGDTPRPTQQHAGLIAAGVFIVAAIALLVGTFLPSATVSVALAVVCGLAGVTFWIRSRSPRRPS